MLLLTAVAWLSILSFGLVLAWCLGEAFSRAADSEPAVGEDHHESFRNAVGSVSFFYEDDIRQWSVTSADNDGMLTAYEHYESFDLAADAYESACNTLELSCEDAARDEAVGV